MLGQNGVVGIKTGNIPAIGGVFVIASEFKPEGRDPITVVGAVQGANTTYAAIAESGRLAETAKTLFVEKTIVKKGAIVARITTPWGESSDVVAASDITTFGWKYATIEPRLELTNGTPFESGTVRGKITVGDASSDLVATSTINTPSLWWRITASR